MESIPIFTPVLVADGKVWQGEDVSIGILAFFPGKIEQVKLSPEPSIPSYIEYIDYDGKARRAQASIRLETMQEAVTRLHWSYDDLASGVWHVFRPDY